MIAHPHITGVVLAGGRATRMGGANKALLPVGPRGASTPLDRILAVFAGRFAGCVVVAPDPEPFLGRPVTVAGDVHQGCGPLGGLHAGLRAVRTPAAFVCGGDMPSLRGPLLDLMAARWREGRALVPVVAGRAEPLHAIYPVACAPRADAALREGVRMMTDFLARLDVDWLREEDLADLEDAAGSFENLNTPGDLERWRA